VDAPPSPPQRRVPTALVGRLLLSVALLVSVIAVVAVVGRVSPVTAVQSLLQGAFGSPSAWELTLRRATPILLTGLAVAWAFRAGLFNIGAEGQLLWGAVAAGWVGYAVPLPPGLHALAALLAGATAGALWALPAALLKSRRGVPEVITTLLLGFTAEHLTRFLANGPLHDPSRQGPRMPDVLPSAVLPPLWGSLHVGVLLAGLAAVGLAAVLARGVFGFQVQVVGRNAEAARASRVDVPRVWTLALVQSGALAGLAGAVEVLGVHRFFQAGFSPGYGYEGIAVAILATSQPLGVLLSALFWGALANGAVEMEMSTGLSRYVVLVIQALVVLAVAVRRWPVSIPRRIHAAPPAAAAEG
jgi:ABC-type uncharacterized transport system permease subunit